MARLGEWASEKAGVPAWLLGESRSVVGDLAETIALVLPEPARASERGLAEWIGMIGTLRGLDETKRKATVWDAWDQLGFGERLLFNKLIVGGFRTQVSQTVMTRVLSRVTGKRGPDLAYRLSGNWTPDTTTFDDLLLSPAPEAGLAKPYPFSMAEDLDEPPENLGAPEHWLAEWNRDGLRGQVVIRAGRHFLWTGDGELVTDRFPELAVLKDFLPDGTVLDGEFLAWANDTPLPLTALQKRIARKAVTKAALAEYPVVFLAFDLLETDGTDLTAAPLSERRTRLENLLSSLPGALPLRLSRQIGFDSWGALVDVHARCHEVNAAGLNLRHLPAPNAPDRDAASSRIWKANPHSCDAVLIYAHTGGGSAARFDAFTFAVWHHGELVPLTRTSAGLSDAEIAEITDWVRKNVQQRFGPVRQILPELVFEIAFDGIAASARHKSGVTLRGPRVTRWRRGTPAVGANRLEDLRALL